MNHHATANHPDEAGLPAAREALHDALHTFAGRTTTHITRDDGTTELHFGDPLITQLEDYLDSAQGDGSTGSFHRRSMAPVVLDALELLTTITTTLGVWIANLQLPATPTPLDMLHQLQDRTWRPQDINIICTITTTLDGWTRATRILLDPPRRWTLPAPCPACQVATVYRPDTAGEHVRQPALQITAHGCTCLNCKHTWEPQLFAHLARTLGTLPDNVLE